MMMWKKIIETIVDIIFPKNCLNCGKEGKYICEECELFLSETPNLLKQEGLEELVSVWEYDGLIKKIIFKIKHDGMFDAINELIEKAFKVREPYIPENTIITFVPMFKKKEKQRGFNQAELIAKKLGRITNREVLPLLEKIKDISVQGESNKIERMADIRGSFKKFGVKENKYFDNVLLVDDIWISGATMAECVRVLKDSGVKKVFGFTLARIV